VSLDCCIIGGGIIGLSIARELAGRGHRVRVLARDRRRDTASWAAAGIFPPVSARPSADANLALTAFSDRLHRTWARELRAETGIDNGLVACGGLHVAAGEANLSLLEVEANEWRSRGVQCDWIDAAGIIRLEPVLAAAVASDRISGGLLLPDEMRIRPPRHLEALERSCSARGVRLVSETEVVGVTVAAGRLTGVEAVVAGRR
jgi:glycine oxidase